MDIERVVERMQVRLAELDEQDGDLEAEQRNIAQMRASLAEERHNLQVAIDLAGEYAAAERAPSPEQAEAFPVPLTGTLADAAAQLLRRSGGEMELAQIHDLLADANKLKISPHSRTTLWKTLNRKPELFHKAGKGRWRLVGGVGEQLDADHPEIKVTTM